MSMISKDFRLNQQQTGQSRYFRIRWAVLAIAFAGIGAVIANTNTGSNNSAKDLERISSGSLPAFEPVASTVDKLARDSFSLSLPELQAQQKIIDDASNLAPKQWREFKVKSGDSLAQLFRRNKRLPLRSSQG